MKSVNAVDILRDAFRVYQRHAATVVGIALLFQGLFVFLTFALVNQFGLGGFALVGLLSVIVNQLTLGVYTVLLVGLRLNDEPPTIGALLNTALPRALPLLWLATLSGFGIGFASLLFLLPGLYVGIRWAVAVPVLVTSRESAVQSLKTSWHMTGPAFGSVLVIVLFQGLIVLGIPYVTRHLGPDLALEEVLLMQALVTALMMPLVGLSLGGLFLALAGPLPDDASPLAPYVPAGPPPVPYSPRAPYGEAATAPVGYTPGAPYAPAPAYPPAYPTTTPAPLDPPAAPPPGPQSPAPPRSTERTHSVPPPGMH